MRKLIIETTVMGVLTVYITAYTNVMEAVCNVLHNVGLTINELVKYSIV
jgi:hypothetical protein